MNKILAVKCPQCALEFNYYQSENRPFCSERCKSIDLGHWFTENYTIPGRPGEISEEDIYKVEQGMMNNETE